MVIEYEDCSVEWLGMFVDRNFDYFAYSKWWELSLNVILLLTLKYG